MLFLQEENEGSLSRGAARQEDDTRFAEAARALKLLKKGLTFRGREVRGIR